jgi:ParB-like chromosome segregation protein Spo0J
MHLTNKVVALLLLPVLLISSPALAQQPRVVDSAAMNQALASKTDSELAQRELVRRVLNRDDVRQMAAHMGLSVEDASSAVATLSGAELDALAQHAGAVEAVTLTGGVNTNAITISLTTLLLIIIIVILLVK